MKKPFNITIVITILLLINPFIDLLTSIFIKNIDMSFSIGIILRLVLVLLLFINYYIFNKGYKNMKFNIFLGLIILLTALYGFHFYAISTNFTFIQRNLIELFKVLYLPIFFILIYFSLGKEKIKNIDKYVVLSIALYSILIIIPFITNTAFSSYAHSKTGTVGWFYAANEIGNIIAISLPLIFKYLLDRRNKVLYKLFVFILVMSAIIIIGTKTPIIALFLTAFGYLIYFMIKTFKERKNINKVLIGVISLIIFVSIIPFTPFYDNLKIHVEYLNITNPTELLTNPQKLDHFFLGERVTFFNNTLDIYSSRDLRIKFWGIGYLEPCTNNEYKTVEMDFADILFRNGIVLFLMIFIMLPIIYFKGVKINKENFIYLISLLLALLISSIAGHVLVSPSVGLFVLILLLSLKKQEEVELKNKISLLSLHMGVGGIEKTLVSQANMLSKKYDVEIISLYKLSEKIPYNINKKVKLIYLSDLKPNKEEFLKEYRNKNILGILKQGIKASYILCMKTSLVSKFIKNSDSKVIISTRKEFTRLLNKYGNSSATLIAEEHEHHRYSEKYIKRLERSITHIDYLMPTSKYLTNYYRWRYKNVSVKYIPNALDIIPKEANKGTAPNIISVGRFVKGKGFTEIVEIFAEIVKEVPKAKLTLAGDGKEMKKVKALVRKNNLQKKVKLTGFISQKELQKEYKKSSVYLMTSYEESFGLVLIEAMAYGVPCFAYSCAQGAHEVINGENGKLIKDRNKEEMINEVTNYLKLKNKKKYIEASRETAQFYSKEKVEKEWFKFIDKIM